MQDNNRREYGVFAFINIIQEYMENKDELIDCYGYEAEIFSKSYYMMGHLLDKDFVEKEVEKRQLTELFVYGGGYLGIQLYRAISPFVNVLSVVDKKGKLLIDSIDDIPIMDMETFQCQYESQPVIVTPLKFYREIFTELRKFVPEDKIIFLQEFGR